MWPAGQEFDFVHKEMPRKRGPTGMFEQYRELMRRVRRAAKSGWLSESWHQMEKVMVQSVMTYGKLNATLGRMSPWKFLSAAGRTQLHLRSDWPHGRLVGSRWWTWLLFSVAEECERGADVGRWQPRFFSGTAFQDGFLAA